MIRSDEDYESARARQDAEAAAERSRAEELWRRFEKVPDAQARRDLALTDSGFRSWAFCEKLCRESAAAADDDAGRDAQLAELALKLASKVPGENSLRCRIQEHVWTHVSNARRAQGDLEGAVEALRRAEEFLVGGSMGVLPSPIRRDRIHLLEAALLRDQGRLGEALEKIGFGLGGQTDVEVKVALFLEEGRLRRWLGKSKKALDSFSLADREASRISDPRLLLRLEIERGFALCDLGRHGEVEELPAGLRKAAAGFPVERGRLLCLKGRVAAGRGQPEEAEEALRTVLADLHDRVLADAALLSLELAALQARLGRTADLEALAGPLRRLAEAPALARGAAATLKLFVRLAEQDKMTAERAAQFARDFPRGPV